MNAAIIPYDIEAQKLQAAKLVEGVSLSTLTLAAKQLEVKDEDSYQSAIDLRNRFASAEKRITEFWEPLTKAANALHKAMTGAKAEMLKPYTDGKSTCTTKAEKFLNDRKRQEREANERIARAAQKTQEELLAEANELAIRGKFRDAEALQMQAQMVVAPQLPSSVPIAAGAKVGDKFKGEVTDIIAFAKAVVEGRIDLMQEVKPGDVRPILVVDQVVLNAVVHRQMAGLNWPGVTVSESAKISSAGVR